MEDKLGSDVAKVESAAQGPFIDREKFPLLADKTPDELQKLEKRVKLRVDLRLMPMLVLIYIMNYLDRYGCVVILCQICGSRRLTFYE